MYRYIFASLIVCSFPATSLVASDIRFSALDREEQDRRPVGNVAFKSAALLQHTEEMAYEVGTFASSRAVENMKNNSIHMRYCMNIFHYGIIYVQNTRSNHAGYYALNHHRPIDVYDVFKDFRKTITVIPTIREGENTGKIGLSTKALWTTLSHQLSHFSSHEDDGIIINLFRHEAKDGVHFGNFKLKRVELPSLLNYREILKNYLSEFPAQANNQPLKMRIFEPISRRILTMTMTTTYDHLMPKNLTHTSIPWYLKENPKIGSEDYSFTIHLNNPYTADNPVLGGLELSFSN